MGKPKHVYEVYIRTTAEQLWAAITSPDLTRKYFYDGAVESDFRPGSRYTYRNKEGKPLLQGEILQVEQSLKLMMTFSAVWDADSAKDRPSRVTWEITQMGKVCKLTLVHDDFDGETKTYQMVGSGWNPVLSGLKTLLETGRPLEIPDA